MSAEMASPLTGAGRAPVAPGRVRRAGRGSSTAAPVRPVVGALADGTLCYAPVGEVVVSGSLVTCHLCGRALRSVTAHLAAHGWTKQQYCEAFGLERGQSLEGPDTRKLRATALAARLVFEPAIRDGSAAGRQRARAGELAGDAAAAARGRAFPAQRRRKTARARQEIAPEAIARANRERADRHLASVADAAARRTGHPDLRALVLARTRAGDSLAEISRRAGLHKDWLSRHLGRLDPAVAQAARQGARDRLDAPWLPVLRGLGFGDVAAYLAERHAGQHRTVTAIAAETGFSRHAVESALRRHGLDRVGHAAKRHAARQRAARVAADLGYPGIAGYIGARRSQGWTWNAIAAESGQPQTWLRRHATDPG